MSYIRHNAIIVTSVHSDKLIEAINIAQELGLQVLGPSLPAINAYSSIFICPDDSKESWPDNTNFDFMSIRFINWLNSQVYKDCSSLYEWVEVSYCNDHPATVHHQSYNNRCEYDE
jgi:hypothetical protein